MEGLGRVEFGPPDRGWVLVQRFLMESHLHLVSPAL